MEKIVIFIKKLRNFFVIKINSVLNFIESEYMLKKYKLETTKIDLVFDIGYNFGNFSKALLRNNKNLKIIGVDANIKMLNLSYNHQNIIKINSLMSDQKNILKKFYINNKFPGASTASEEFLNKSRLAEGSKTQESIKDTFDEIKNVKTSTLDNLIKEYGIPDLIKIDVEGYEKQVIKGLTIKTPKITFEWSEEMVDDLNEIIVYLKKIGFSKFGAIGYFVEKNSNVLFSRKGDPFLIEPEYFAWEDLNLNSILKKDRKISYGMIWAK